MDLLSLFCIAAFINSFWLGRPISFHQAIQNEVLTVRFQCPYCKTILDIDDCQPGELVACGKCGNAVNVPLSKTAPGAIIGDFVVLREIGTGGMGTVFLAHQISLDRDVALKILLPAFESDKRFLQDFINEARMAAQIRHPNVVEAYAVG